jgi:hypothetical protein
LFRNQSAKRFLITGVAGGALSREGFTAPVRTSIVRRNLDDQGETYVKRLIHVAGLCLLLSVSVVSLRALAHTPQQPPHQIYNEGDLKLESGETIKDF